jgi:hypothetical protein
LLLYCDIERFNGDIQSLEIRRTLKQHIADAYEIYERYLKSGASLRVPEEAVSAQAAEEIVHALDELELDADVDMAAEVVVLKEKSSGPAEDIEVDDEKKPVLSYGESLLEIFASAQAGALRYLLEDTYPNFVRSDQFKQLLSHVEEVRKEVEIYKELNLVESDPEA